jgi:acyl-CoA reductase-like NAD-dependent aldehyde dehydrogenase
VGLWLGVKVDPDTGGDRVVLIDPATNEQIGDYTALRRARAAAAEQARAAAEQARAADLRAQAESLARALAEARVRELEAELRRRKGRKTS